MAKVCFHYLLLGCDLRLARDDCLETFSSYGPFLLFTPEKAEMIIRNTMMKCFKILNERFDMKSLQKAIYVEHGMFGTNVV